MSNQRPGRDRPSPGRGGRATPRKSPPSARTPGKSPGVSRTVPTGTVSEETRAKLDALQSQWGNLQESLLLTSVRTEAEDITTTLSMLPTEIAQLRTRGYVFRSFLERKIGVLAEQWEEMHERVSREVARHQRELKQEADDVENALREAMGGRASQVARAESALEALERKVKAARSSAEALYSTLQENVDQAHTQVKDIRWLLDQLGEAGFQLHPAEDPITACKAQYMETKKEGPEGVLYLTDERLIFEQKEDVATKKVLFITTEKEKVQELVFAVPVGQIEEVKTQQKGFLGHKEMMEVLFAPEADLSGATLRLRGANNEEWAGLIGRVKSGEIAKERTRPKDEATVEAARAVPTKCTTCGATLSVEITRGMREITCEYCGSVIRL